MGETSTKGLIGWNPSCWIEILTPPTQPAKNFCLNAPETGKIYPYLTVRAGKQVHNETLKYLKVGQEGGKLGLQIETYTDFGSRFSHYVADANQGPARVLRHKTLASINDQNVSSYDHKQFIALLKKTKKPMNVGYY